MKAKLINKLLNKNSVPLREHFPNRFYYKNLSTLKIVIGLTLLNTGKELFWLIFSEQNASFH
jgi:hypothetical protein